jgi:hypothetical protein
MASVVARTLMVVGAAAALAAGSAHASDVHWSVGIQAPIAPGVSVGTVISNQHALPVVAPVLVAPPPVYVPAPVVYAPPIYAPPIYTRPVYAPQVVYGAPVWAGGRWVRYPVHHHPHPGVWRPGFDHHVAPVPVRMPGREIRY